MTCCRMLLRDETEVIQTCSPDDSHKVVCMSCGIWLELTLLCLMTESSKSLMKVRRCFHTFIIQYYANHEHEEFVLILVYIYLKLNLSPAFFFNIYD